MTDTITMPRAEYDETTAQLRYQAREIERLRGALDEMSETVEALKVKYVQPNVDASTHATTAIERAVARLAKIKGGKHDGLS